jgi:hypothetical protein
MKKTLAVMAIAAVMAVGCTTTTSTPGPDGTTNTVTTTKGIDPATAAQVDTIVQQIISEAPAAISDAQAISGLVHGTNASK